MKKTRAEVHTARRKVLLLSAVQVACFAGLISYLAHTFGLAAFAAGLGAVNAWTVLLALGCGFTGTLAQAARWRIVCRGYGMELSVGQALRQCYSASLLNSVLPSGVAGDVFRAVRHRSAKQSSWSSAVGSVAGERLAGTVVVVLAAAVALLRIDWRLSLATTAVAGAVFAAAWPSLRRLLLRASMSVWVLSILAWLSFATMFCAAALLTTPDLALFHLAGLAAICLASMFIPLGVGGWGPREGATALAFLAYGYSGAGGVAAATGYGLLALVSVLPGADTLVAVSPLAMRVRTAGLRLQKYRDTTRPHRLDRGILPRPPFR